MYCIQKDRCLYHYTSFESAVKIVSSRTLRFSTIRTLNDINESCGPMVFCENPDDYAELNKVLKGYSLLSLTMDSKRFGFDIPAMWGHYGKGGHGACLVIDKVQCLKDAEALGLSHDFVKYNTSGAIIKDLLYSRKYGSLAEFIEKDKDSIFFHKTPDWSFEQEYRIIINSGEGSLFDINNSLIAIILFSRTHEEFIQSVEFRTFSKLGPDLDLIRYECPLGVFGLYNKDGNCLKPQIKYNLSIPIISTDGHE